MLRRTRILLVALLVGSACNEARVNSPETAHPGLTFPARFAEGENDAAVPPEKPPAPASEPPKHGTLPDPEPQRLAEQWEYELLYDRGRVRVKSVRPLRFAEPVVTARQVGRYAIELWIGRELVDRVRFDFPLLAAEEPATGRRRPLKQPPSFLEGAVVSRSVLVPRSPRATRAVLVDRATGQETQLPWPPDAPLGPPRSSIERRDAGRSDAESAPLGADAGPRTQDGGSG